ncbi:MAG: glycosyltransferase family 4 protein [Nitrospiraceae bacterium]
MGLTSAGRRPRIGVDACCWSNRRGFGRFTRELLSALVASDPDRDYIFFVDQDTARTGMFPREARVVTASTDVAPAVAASASGRRSLKDMWTLSHAVAREPIDLFFFPAVYSYFPIMNRCKIVVTIHDMIADHHPEHVFPNWKAKCFWKLKQRVALLQAHSILTVSNHAKQQIVTYFRIPESRVATTTEGPTHAFVHLPFSDRTAEILSRIGLRTDEPFVLYVGGISPHKNLSVLVDAFHRVGADPCFAGHKLVLVGDYQGDVFYSYYDALRADIDRHGLQPKVIFTGFVSDLELVELYNAAQAAVLPSLEEGFGLPAVEAMACGTPIICSDRGSLPEVVGPAGQLFDPGRPDELAAVLRQVLGNERLRDSMREAGLQRSRTFTWDAAAQSTLALFDRLIGSRKP